MRLPGLDRYLVANLLLWLVTYLLITVRMVGPEMSTPPAELLGRRAIVTIAAVFVCMGIQHVLLRTRRWPKGRRLALGAGLAAAGGLFWAVFNHLVFYELLPITDEPYTLQDLALGLAINFSVLVWSFIAWVAIVFALAYDEEVREASLRLAQAQALAAEAQTQMLRYQINPHFLFNTLNALSALILQKDTERAERMVMALSRFLRGSLEKPPAEKTTLAAEIEVQRQYLEIEEIRFGERLRTEVAAPAETAEALVPGLILQPLVENAIKHGAARTTGPVTIRIAAETRDGRLTITVADDARAGTGEGPPRLGVGLENVRRRLALLYGEAGRLACAAREGGGFAATIELPLERA